MTLGYSSEPLGTRLSNTPPNVGDLIAWDFRVWRVIEVNEIPEDRWTDRDRTSAKGWKRDIGVPRMVIVRPVRITSTDVRARDHDKHLKHMGGVRWPIFVSAEHYPVCGHCGGTLPCRAVLAERQAEREMAHLERYLVPGQCPSCNEPISARQKSFTFEENLEMPGGPPVTFHIGRSNCRYDASTYEKRWVALDPENRRTTFSCPGTITNHGDKTHECTAMFECRGPLSFHAVYQVCNSNGCCTPRPYDCHPWPDSKLRLPGQVPGEETPERVA